DNCGVTSFTSSHNSGATFPIGTTTVTYTAVDAAGNSVQCSFDVTITDDDNPVISGCPSNISQGTDASGCNAVVNWTAPTAADNCGVTSFTSSHNSGATFPIGTTTVTYTAVDAAGNSVQCSFDVTITDDDNPVISGCPSNISQGTDASGCNAVVNWTAPTAADNCGVTSFTSSHNPGATFPI
ncbi:HYR domain-containing protein, partial [Geojedonia litorea]